MINLTARAYFKKLAALLERIEVTDAAGETIDLDQAASLAADRLLDCKRAGNKVLLIGNGGSSAIAGHMQSDLAKSVRVRALVFHDIPHLTAIVNDDGWEQVFAQPLALWVDAGDVLVAVSSSGRSPNIVRAATEAKTHGADVITLSGFGADNPVRKLGTMNFWVNSSSYGMVEAAHTALSHFLTDRARSIVRGEDPQ